jgi:glucose 1-dehydrogenase
VTGGAARGGDDLAGKVAIVTGAAAGMGRAAAISLGEVGAKVVAADISDVSSTVDDITAVGGTAIGVRADVSVSDDVVAMVRAAVDAFGRLDVAVNAAGIEVEHDRIADADVAVFDRVIAVNLRSIFLCLKYEISAMLDAGRGGSIVNFASTNAVRPQATQSAYNASKFGVVGLTKTAALEYGRHGVRVNAVAPGAIDTAMLQRSIAERGADPDKLRRRYSVLDRFGQPSEVSQAVLWLCSDQSAFTTGHLLTVDGGLLIR